MGSPANPSEALVIAARYPEVGAVKTRLARHIGDEMACQLYISFLRDLQAKFGGRQRPLFWAYTPPQSPFPSFMNAESRCFPQEGARLGDRVLNTFRYMFHQGFQRVVVMGSDVPHMLPEWIDEAFACLIGADAVFAPADDGGYNLVGLTQPHDLFSDMPMSTPQLLAETLERARTRGFSVRLLPASFDVDEIEDLDKLRRFITGHRTSLPHTQQVLKQMRMWP